MGIMQQQEKTIEGYQIISISMLGKMTSRVKCQFLSLIQVKKMFRYSYLKYLYRKLSDKIHARHPHVIKFINSQKTNILT